MTNSYNPDRWINGKCLEENYVCDSLISLGYTERIDFVCQRTFKGVKGPRCTHGYRYDIYFSAKNLVIEVDGYDHFSSTWTKTGDIPKTLQLIDLTSHTLLRLAMF